MEVPENTKNKPGMVAHSCSIQDMEVGRLWIWSEPGQSLWDSFSKTK
jgi:hypothetical protein